MFPTWASATSTMGARAVLMCSMGMQSTYFTGLLPPPTLNRRLIISRYSLPSHPYLGQQDPVDAGAGILGGVHQHLAVSPGRDLQLRVTHLCSLLSSVFFLLTMAMVSSLFSRLRGKQCYLLVSVRSKQQPPVHL